MWPITLRDLQWRRRRFILAVIAAGLAFALALIMNGTLQHMRNESRRTVGLYDANAWVVAHGVSGPFTTSQFVPVSTAAALRQDAGVTSASPLLVVRSVIDKLDVNIGGYELGGATQPHKLAKGSAPTTRGVAIVDTSLHRHVGDTLTFAGRSYPVAALTTNTTFYFGMPTVFLPIEDMQDQFLAGQALASAIVVRGTPSPAPAYDVLGLYQPGSYFGELAPLYGLRRSATARAVIPSLVIGYSATEFRQRQHEHEAMKATSDNQ